MVLDTSTIIFFFFLLVSQEIYWEEESKVNLNGERLPSRWPPPPLPPPPLQYMPADLNASSFTTTIRKVETDIVVDSRPDKSSLTTTVSTTNNTSKIFSNRYWPSSSSSSLLTPLDVGSSVRPCGNKLFEDEVTSTVPSSSDVLSLDQLASQPPILTPSWEIIKVMVIFVRVKCTV